MIKFRPVRGTLTESMAAVKEFKSKEDLLCHIEEIYPVWMVFDNISCEDIDLIKYGEGIDERNGWDTYVVTLDDIAVGFTNGDFKND